MINPRTKRDRQLIVLRQIRLRLIFERRFARQVTKLLKDASQRSADGYEITGQVALDIVIREHRDEMVAAFIDHYTRVTSAFGGDLISSMKSAGIPETKNVSTTFQDLILRWIKTTAALRVTKIINTTRNAIIRVIQSGVEDGIGQNEIAKRIREKTGGVIATARARIIARVETHAASNAANIQAAEALNVPGLRKEWLSAEDGRVRIDHANADGQTVDQAAKFEVGGSSLNQPGDPSAPPDQIINCRCAIAFITPDP